jgi:hypothetical protein
VENQKDPPGTHKAVFRLASQSVGDRDGQWMDSVLVNTSLPTAIKLSCDGLELSALNSHTVTHTNTDTHTHTHTHKLLSAVRFRIPYMFSRHNTNIWSAVSNWTWKETSKCYALKQAYSFFYLVRITSAKLRLYAGNMNWNAQHEELISTRINVWIIVRTYISVHHAQYI